MNRLPINTLIRLFTPLAVAAMILLPAHDAHADATLEIKGQVGMASATHDQEGGAVDAPIFSVGGGGAVAALLGLGGLAVGLDFRYFYESHQTQSNTGSGAGGTMAYSVPSLGIKVRFDLMPQITASLFANYAFGSACVVSNGGIQGADFDWGIQGLDAGGEVEYNYQIKPYKTYVIIGLFAHYQYLVMLNASTTVNAPNLISNNIGGGINLGARFDFGL